jgi:antirestriction protein ArdC
MNTYELITNRILEKMERGQVPWRRPWKFDAPRNLVSKRSYHGINLLLLTMSDYDCPYWLSFNQAKQLGGSIKKGEHGTPVVFWKLLEVGGEEAEREEEKPKTIPFLRYSTVFNLRQTEGIEAPKDKAKDAEPLAECEKIIAGFRDRPETLHTLEPRAYYSPSRDSVHMPRKSSFISPEAYYATLFHEYTHATGHEKRLNRHAERETNFDFGSQDYSREELVAELGSAFLSAKAKIDNSVMDNSAAYLASWLKVLKADIKLLIHASARAQRAVDYMLGREEVRKQ